uniref:Integron gene cassette protein n=2 Tax=Bursaphelenchus xylophilus TaxID=6326 RepID=A0A1I7SFZ2_BURXY
PACDKPKQLECRAANSPMVENERRAREKKQERPVKLERHARQINSPFSNCGAGSWTLARMNEKSLVNWVVIAATRRAHSQTATNRLLSADVAPGTSRRAGRGDGRTVSPSDGRCVMIAAMSATALVAIRRHSLRWEKSDESGSRRKFRDKN